MKRILSTILFLLLWHVPAFASFTSVGVTTVSGAGASTTIVSPAIASVHVGDLVVSYSTSESSNTNGVSDGTTAFTCLTQEGAGTTHGRLCYLLASVASGSVTYTATFAASVSTRFIGVWVFTPTAAVSVDQSNQATSSGTTASSGNVTTTGSDELAFAGFAGNGGTFSVRQIGGVNAIASDTDGLGTIWYNTQTGTIAATITDSAASRGSISLATFKIAGGGGGGGPKSLVGAGGLVGPGGLTVSGGLVR